MIARWPFGSLRGLRSGGFCEIRFETRFWQNVREFFTPRTKIFQRSKFFTPPKVLGVPPISETRRENFFQNCFKTVFGKKGISQVFQSSGKGLIENYTACTVSCAALFRNTFGTILDNYLDVDSKTFHATSEKQVLTLKFSEYVSENFFKN